MMKFVALLLVALPLVGQEKPQQFTATATSTDGKQKVAVTIYTGAALGSKVLWYWAAYKIVHDPNPHRIDSTIREIGFTDWGDIVAFRQALKDFKADYPQWQQEHTKWAAEVEQERAISGKTRDAVVAAMAKNGWERPKKYERFETYHHAFVNAATSQGNALLDRYLSSIDVYSTDPHEGDK